MLSVGERLAASHLCQTEILRSQQYSERCQACDVDSDAVYMHLGVRSNTWVDRSDIGTGDVCT